MSSKHLHSIHGAFRVQGGIDYSKFQASLERLEEQHANFLDYKPDLPTLIQEAIAESVVRRFKTCCDCLWKVLRRHLVEVLGVVDLPNSPKPVLRVAHQNDLLHAPVEQWLSYADKRNDTSHDCDGEKAKACLKVMPEFIKDAICLYETMSGDSWE